MLRAIKLILLTFTLSLATAWLVLFLTLRFESHQYTELSAAQRAHAEGYLAANFEALPDGFRWAEFMPEPGVVLRSGEISAPDPIGTVVIVPGFTSPIEMQARAIKAFYSAGYKVAVIDYRGQGGSWRPLANPEKGHVEDYAVLADDVAGYANTVKIAGKPLFFHSISKGAHITMRMAEFNVVGASAFALVVPMIEINVGDIDPKHLKRFSSLVSLLGLGEVFAPGAKQWPTEELVFGAANDCNANPATAQLQSALFASNPELRLGGVTMQWLAATLSSSEHLLSDSYAQQMKTPVMVFNAGDDRIVKAESAAQFCSSLAQCETVDYVQSRHCINRENIEVYDDILQRSIAFFKQNS